MAQETYFDVFGPFEVDADLITSGRKQVELWESVERRKPGLSAAIGCYMFCMCRAGHNTPWYVGMTINRNGFVDEAFQEHELQHYRSIIQKSPNGAKPHLFLFPLLLRHSGRFGRGSSKKRVILWLERMLMGFAYWQNDDIANSRDMAFLKSVTVNGLFGAPPKGRPKGDVVQAAKALFGKD